MAMLGTMIRYLAEGRGEGMEDWMHTALEEEYGIVTEERRLQKEELASFEAEETNRKFKESFPFCDKHSVTIADAIALENKRRENAFSDSEELIKTSHSDTDPRVLRIFCSGYDVGADGEPLTAEDTEKKERDMRFIGDYCSGDVSRRFPQLERITGEIMGISLTPDMLTEEYIIAHAAELKCIGDRMSYFENIMRRNKDYFDSLPQPELDSIKARATLWAAFSSYVANFVNIKGINFQNGELFRAGDRPTVSNAHLWGETLYKRTLDAMERMEIRRSMGYA
jgi:hypothetical protein